VGCVGAVFGGLPTPPTLALLGSKNYWGQFGWVCVSLNQFETQAKKKRQGGGALLSWLLCLDFVLGGGFLGVWGGGPAAPYFSCSFLISRAGGLAGFF